MRYALVSLALVAAAAGSAAAQPITSYTLKVCVRGTDCSSPVQTQTIPVSEVRTGQPKVAAPTGTIQNPRYVRWDDPASPSTLDVVWDSGATSGQLFSLPFSTTLVYDSVITATNSAGVGPESARSNPFSRPGSAPAVPTGLRVTGS